MSLSKGARRCARKTRNSSRIYVDIRDRDIGSYVRDAQKAVREQVNFLPSYGAVERSLILERATEAEAGGAATLVIISCCCT